MAYNQDLAERVRQAMADQPDLDERRMFGGVGYLIRGNMACGVMDDDLIVRVGPDAYEGALARPGVREFDITGRAMRGWVMVSSEATAEDEALAQWVGLGLDFADGLPAKA